MKPPCVKCANNVQDGDFTGLYFCFHDRSDEEKELEQGLCLENPCKHGANLPPHSDYYDSPIKQKKPALVSDPSQPIKIFLMILFLLGASYVSFRVINLLEIIAAK